MVKRYFARKSWVSLYIRIDRQNAGWSKSTKSGIPWELKYFEKHETRSEAMKHECKIKRMKSRIYIEDLIR